MPDMIRDIMVRQGGLRFSWKPGTRRIEVATPSGVVVEEITAGNVFDSRPASLDEVHDAIDDYCAQERPSGQ